MCHARAVDLGVDVAHQVGLVIEVLDERERVVRRRARRMPLEYLDCGVALQFAAEAGTEQLAAHAVVQQRNAVEIRLHRVARQRLERRLGAQHARRPVRLGIEHAERAEQRPAQRQRQPRTQPLFVDVPAVAAIAAKSLVAAVAGQRDGYVLARELAHAVRRHRGTVGIWLVVERGKLVHETEVLGIHLLNAMPRVIALRNRLSIGGLVECRIAERDRARVDRFRGQSRHHRHDTAGIDPARQKCAQRHFRHQADFHRFAQPHGQLFARILLGHRRSGLEGNVPVFARLAQRLAAPHQERACRRQFQRAAKNRARLGHVAIGKIILDRRRIDVAPQTRMREQRLQLRAKNQHAVVQHRVVKRLNAEAVAREKQRLPVAVP